MLLTDLTPAPVRSRMAVPDTALLALLGSRDESLRAAEELLDADVHVRGNELTLSGAPADVAFAERVFGELISLAQRGQHVGTDTVRRTVEMLSDVRHRRRIGRVARRGAQPGHPVPPREDDPAQDAQPEALRRRDRLNTIVFGIGPAGTGKTYLAMAKAVQALQAKQVNRIILTRPAVEAGERLGYLPGTLYEKIDPYLRPLYDALHDMIDPESIPKLMAAGTIEVAPLAYMRGRTLERRIHHSRRGPEHHARADEDVPHPPRVRQKIVVTGDVTQIDLPGSTRSGLQVVRDILDGIDDVALLAT